MIIFLTNRAICLMLLMLAGLATVPASAQVTGPPVGGPSGQFLGPPATTAQGFMGLWDFTWEGPTGSGCPCSGTLAIGTDSQGQLIGRWDLKGAPARLTGSVGYDQNVWTGRFQQSDDVDFPLRGHFRLESRGDGLLTGSYQPDGTAVPFTWRGRQ